MRRLVVIFCFISLFSFPTLSQELDELDRYKYIIVETLVYPNNEIDKYQMSTMARQQFMKLGYLVIPEDPSSWPEDLRANPCLSLLAKITSKAPKFGKYKVTLTLFNCQQGAVYTYTAGGAGDEVPVAYQNGIKGCFSKLRKHKYEYDEARSLSSSAQQEKYEVPNEELIGAYRVNSEGKIALKIVADDSREFLKAVVVKSKNKTWKEGEELFTVRDSDIAGVYAISWLNDDKQTTYETFGYRAEESGNLVIEFKNPTNPRPALTLKLE